LPHFENKLREKHQSESSREQACHAVVLYYEEMFAVGRDTATTKADQADHVEVAQRHVVPPSDVELAGASWKWVYEKLNAAIQVRHYSPKTLQAYKNRTKGIRESRGGSQGKEKTLYPGGFISGGSGSGHWSSRLSL
jgi:hypothetical protein